MTEHEGEKAARRCWRSECRTGCYYPDVCSERPTTEKAAPCLEPPTTVRTSTCRCRLTYDDDHGRTRHNRCPNEVPIDRPICRCCETAGHPSSPDFNPVPPGTP